MITDILDYINAYDEIRAVCGLSKEELPDATLALSVYRHRLGLSLRGISGIYAPSTVSENLQEIYERPLATSDPLYAAIQLYSIYMVSDVVIESIGLRSYKIRSEGKASLTRFSPESTFKGVRQGIIDGLNIAKLQITELLGETATTFETIRVVTPSIDLVTGE